MKNIDSKKKLQIKLIPENRKLQNLFKLTTTLHHSDTQTLDKFRTHIASDIKTAFLKYQDTIHVNAGYNLFTTKADRTRQQNTIVNQVDTQPMGLGHATSR